MSIPKPKRTDFVRSETNGLANWRKRIAAEKEQKMEELEELRKDAKTVEIDGREFKVVRIPDKYAWSGKS